LAGVGGWVLSYPMDYVKSQIQAEPWNRKSVFRKHPILFDGGFIDAWRKTVQKQGHAQLWKGFGVCMARAWPANAMGFLAYESALTLLRGNGWLAGAPKQL
jgi:solute carrier family 25 carnitine/acylcarnitine transporter 20/29